MMSCSRVKQNRVRAALFVFACAALGTVGGPPPAHAQQFPTKPIRLIVPFTPGGGTDIVSRTVGQKLTEVWGKTVVVDNRPGAGGIMASEIVAKAPPDGYTLGVVTPTQTINPSLHSNLPFDPVNDFAPVILMTRLQLILVSNPSFPANNVKELVALAKAKPGQLTFASTGTGGAAHLAVELLKKMTGIDMVHVPYKGSAPAYADVMSGQVQLLSNNIISTMPLVKSGRLKAIAVTGAKRSVIAPDVPSVAEAGLPGFDVTSWFGVVAPAKTPKDVIGKLNGEIARILKLPDVRERLLAQGAEPAGGSPEDFGRLMRDEMKKWGELIRSAGIKADAAPQ